MRLKNWIGSPRRLHLLGTGGGECLRPTGGEGGVDYPGLDQKTCPCIAVLLRSFRA